MSTLTMSRSVSKTYSRTVQKADRAAKIFDDVILGTSGKPSPVKATPIMQKWGKASFTLTRGSPETEPQKTRKRKIEVDKIVPSNDDPFSFDLEDVGSSKTKRGMGYKVPGKTKANVHAVEARNSPVVGQKPIAGRQRKIHNKRGDSCDEMENGSGKLSLFDIPPMDAIGDSLSFVASSPKKFSSNAERNGSIRKNVLKPSEKKQLLMDQFTNKSLLVKNLQSSADFDDSTLTTSARCTERSKPALATKRFFASRNCKGDDITKPSLDGITKSCDSQVVKDDKGEPRHNFDDMWDSDCANWDMETGDPEIIFNSSKKMGSGMNSATKELLTESSGDLQQEAKRDALILSKEVPVPVVGRVHQETGQSKSPTVKRAAKKKKVPTATLR